MQSRLESRTAQLLVILLSMLIVATLVFRTTNAAFSAQTSNPDNSWNSGTVAISDDDNGSAMFNVSGLAPGDTGSHCIEVSYDGSLDTSAIKLYAAVAETDGAADGAVLADNLTILVQYDSGTTGTFAGCGDFSSEGTLFNDDLATLGSTHTNFANGLALGPWAPTGSSGETRVFKFTYTLDAATPNTAQGDGATATFTWEAQS